MDLWKDGISALRNIRAERNLPRDAKPEPVIRVAQGHISAMSSGLTIFQTMAGIGQWRILDLAEALPEDINLARSKGELAAKVLESQEILVPLGDFIDKDAEKAKLRKAMEDLRKQLMGIDGKLNNASFVERAPAELVAQQRQKRDELQTRLDSVLGLLANLEAY